MLAPVWATADAPSGPSFNCAHVTSQVNKIICATPELGALDRKLAADYQATFYQGGIDSKALQADENHWLRSVRNRCTTVACIAAAYQARDAAILDLSLRAASPAAYDDTRPYPAPPAALAAATRLVGSTCGGAPASALPGTSQIAGFLPIVGQNSFIAPVAIQGTEFAFLLTYPAGEPQRCTVRGFVALPQPVQGESFMQCSLSDDSHGFGLRTSKGETIAYWSIPDSNDTLTREPVHVIGEQYLTCEEPESGE